MFRMFTRMMSNSKRVNLYDVMHYQTSLNGLKKEELQAAYASVHKKLTEVTAQNNEVQHKLASKHMLFFHVVKAKEQVNNVAPLKTEEKQLRNDTADLLARLKQETANRVKFANENIAIDDEIFQILQEKGKITDPSLNTKIKSFLEEYKIKYQHRDNGDQYIIEKLLKDLTASEKQSATPVTPSMRR